MSGERVLVAEDDRAIAELLRTYLEGGGFRVQLCRDGGAALEQIRRFRPAVVLLDVGLPTLEGTEVVRRLRASGDRTPVLLVTARDDEVDRIVGLKIGADDYVTKPFSPREVVARVRAVLRRTGDTSSPRDAVLTVGSVHVDAGTRRVTVADQDVPLTTTEFDLLLHLCRNVGRVCSRDSLLDKVWGYPPGLVTRTVDVHIAQLRAKLAGAVTIRSVRGVGYGLDAAAPSAASSAAPGAAPGAAP